jgi:hypothetical protein
MAEMGLQGSGIDALIGQRVAAAMPEHVGVLERAGQSRERHVGLSGTGPPTPNRFAKPPAEATQGLAPSRLIQGGNALRAFTYFGRIMVSPW